jgi:chromosome segregation ATPase
VDVDRRLADIAARAEEDSRHVEELLSALGQSSQVVEQAARIQTEMADAAQALQARAAEMRESLPAQGAMVRQVRESLINYAAASAPTQAAGEILYALLDRLQSMERTADGVDAQLNVGIDRLAKLPEGFGSLRSRATTLLEGARQLEQAHDEALIAVGGWRDEIVAIRTRLAEAVHA